MSSVTVSTAMPPHCSSAATRITAATAAESGSPGVLAGEQFIEEEPLFIGPHPRGKQVRLHGVGIKKVSWRLHDAHSGIFKQTQGSPKYLAVGYEVGVEQQHELRSPRRAQRMPQRVVDVAGLGMPPVGAADISHPELGAQVAQPFAGAIVQHPNTQVAVLDSQGADNGALEDCRASL